MAHTYSIQNIRCGGCAATIRKRLAEAGIEVLEVSPEAQTVRIASDDPQHIQAGAAILKSLGYPLAGEDSGLVDKAKSLVSCAIGKWQATD
jgi:copper chaperone CopZ